MKKQLINKQNVRAEILAAAKELRPGWDCQRVGSEAIEIINTRVRIMIRKMVKAHPTLGKTFTQIL